MYHHREVNKGAKIRSRYNQVPHLTQDTNGKVTNSQLDTTDESQEVRLNDPGHRTKMAAAPIYRKTLKNLLLNHKADDLGTWYVALGCEAYLVSSNDDPMLTLTDFFEKLIFFQNCGGLSHYSHLMRLT